MKVQKYLDQKEIAFTFEVVRHSKINPSISFFISDLKIEEKIGKIDGLKTLY